MKPKSLYLGLCVAGTVLPYSQFLPFLREHGVVGECLEEPSDDQRLGALVHLRDDVDDALVVDAARAAEFLAEELARAPRGLDGH